MSKPCWADDAAWVWLNSTAPSPTLIGFERVNDKDVGREKNMDLQDLKDQSVCSVSALQKIK